MKIAISLLNYRPGRVGGTETYLRCLLGAMAGLAEAGELTAITWTGGREIVPPTLPQATLPTGDRRLVAQRTLEAFTCYRAGGAERLFREGGYDAAFFPQQSIFPKRLAGPAVMTVHDVQHLVMPRNFSLAHRLFRAGIYGYSLRRADHVIAISQFTRRQLIERCGLAPERVTAIPQGFAPLDAAAVAPTRLVEGPYLYYPAATFAHKGHRTLLESYALLRGRGLKDRLVLSGQQTSLWPALRRRIDDLGLGGAVVHLGFLPYAEVLSLYKSARAVVLPTTYEGFGLPVLEAASLGCKVVCSRLEVFEEIGVAPAWRVDFADADALGRALEQPGPTPLLRAPWTWQQTALATLEVLRAAASARPRSRP